MKNKVKILFILIFIFAGLLRLYGINWDHGYHMHPDERAVILFTNQLSFPTSVSDFLSPSSSWNPHFFAYGSLPLYLIYWIGKIIGLFKPEYFSYDYLTAIGRGISLFADLGILSLIFFIGKRLWSNKVGLIASFLYGISVVPIQLSRFYAVDTLLSFFILFTLYLLIRFYEKPSLKLSLVIGAGLAAAFSTKISATVLIVSFFSTIFIDFLLIIKKNPHPKNWVKHLPIFVKNLLFYHLAAGSVTIILFFIFQPYVLIDFPEFWQQTAAQAEMTKSAFTFPYTLQYVGKIPYLYDLTQIFFVGMGPVLALICFIGITKRIFDILTKKAFAFKRQEIILIIFFISYFLVVGKFAVGFIRYMLPLYPIFCLFGGLLIHQLLLKINRSKTFVISVILIGILAWPISFMTIFARPFTRYEASLWILKNVPPSSTLAVEHWDDSLPLLNAGDYKYETLALYDPESDLKWSVVKDSLRKSDYLILSSNRLNIPLRKLTDCQNLPLGKCYKETAKYYEDLFAGKLGYKKVAEFSSFATIPFTNIQLNDQGFDESFSVYDHPVVTIFKNIKSD